MPPKSEVTEEQRKAIIQHRELGLPNMDIAKELGLSTSYTSKIWKEHLRAELGIKRMEINNRASNKVIERLETLGQNPEHYSFLSSVYKASLPDEPKNEINTTVNVGIQLFSKDETEQMQTMFKGREIIDVQSNDQD